MGSGSGLLGCSNGLLEWFDVSEPLLALVIPSHPGPRTAIPLRARSGCCHSEAALNARSPCCRLVLFHSPGVMAGAAPIYPDYRVAAGGVLGPGPGRPLNRRLPIGPVAVAAGIAGLGHRPLKARDRLREQEAALEESGECMKDRDDVASCARVGHGVVGVGPCLQVVSRFCGVIPRVEAHAGPNRQPPSHIQPQQALARPRVSQVGVLVQGQPLALGQQLGLNMCAVHWVQVSSTRLPKSLVTSCMVTWS